MKIKWLGHSAFKIGIEEASILIDPFLKGNPAFTGSFDDEIRGVTHILLTHGHGDHLGDTVAIAAATGAVVVADADLCGFLSRQGVKSLEPMNSGGTIDLGGFSVTMTVAQHSSGFSEDDGLVQALGQAHGLIIKALGIPSVYHMGDTDVFMDMELIQQLHAPQIGLVPIGDRFTMGAKSAAFACNRFFDFSTVIPCHFGTFGLLDQTADQFIAELGKSAGRVKVMASGETLEF